MADEYDSEDDDHAGSGWLEEGTAAVEQLLETLEFNPVTNEAGIVIPIRYKRDPTTWFSTFEDIRDELVEHGDSAASANVPFDGGEPVFSVDTSDAVDDLLDSHGVVTFFESLQSPAGPETPRLFLPSDYAGPQAGLIFRVDVADVNAELIDYLARNPKKMHDLSSRKFEELVAQLLRAKGYDVELTPATRDGGKDIICTQKTDLGAMLIHVECKRYAPDHTVGVGIVRSLYGVVESDRATQGLLVTTSTFTRDAKAFHAKNQHRLSLKDFDALSGWLRNYQMKE